MEGRRKGEEGGREEGKEGGREREEDMKGRRGRAVNSGVRGRFCKHTGTKKTSSSFLPILPFSLPVITPSLCPSPSLSP